MEKFIFVLTLLLFFLMFDPFLRIRNIIASDEKRYINISRNINFSEHISVNRYFSIKNQVNKDFHSKSDELSLVSTKKNDSFITRTFLASVSKDIYKKYSDDNNIKYSSIKANSNEIKDEDLTKEILNLNDVEIAEKENKFKEIDHLYKVKRGDNLDQISKRFWVSVKNIEKWNNLKNDILHPGQKLKIKLKALYYTCKTGDNISKISNKFGVTDDEIILFNSLRKKRIYAGQKLLIVDTVKPYYRVFSRSLKNNIVKVSKINKLLWPVRGRITSGFGYRIHPIKHKRLFHNGIDIAAPIGTPIYAASNGKVLFAARKYFSGKLIMILNSSGLTTLYAHCNKIYVKKGQKIKEGDIIGTVGRTGRVTGAHLHFGIKRGKKFINPMSYL